VASNRSGAGTLPEAPAAGNRWCEKRCELDAASCNQTTGPVGNQIFFAWRGGRWSRRTPAKVCGAKHLHQRFESLPLASQSGVIPTSRELTNRPRCSGDCAKWRTRAHPRTPERAKVARHHRPTSVSFCCSSVARLPQEGNSDISLSRRHGMGPVAPRSSKASRPSRPVQQ